ncbi:MAG: hypothetical protein QOF96_2570, partial [Actinomycetota bacterium]|nr:hypothetical protein [Actinomycetota bacterium]
LSSFTASERSAILGGSRQACATATDLGATLVQTRNEAAWLRRESMRLRNEARTAREGRRR